MVHHHRRLILGVLLGLVLLLVPSTSVLADDPEVEITVSASVVGYPEGFTLTYVNDNQVDIAWTKGESAENTLVRAASGHVPADRTDGYRVYYGDGESCSDTALTLASPEIVYYRAWSENAGGGWSPLFASGNTEDFMSASFLFIGFILLAMSLTWLARRTPDILLRLAAAIAWLGLGAWIWLGDLTNLGMSDPWTRFLAFVPLLMAIVVLLWQTKTDISHEASMRYGRKGVPGYPGASSESWTSWGPKPNRNRKQTAAERQADYRAQVHERIVGKRR